MYNHDLHVNQETCRVHLILYLRFLVVFFFIILFEVWVGRYENNEDYHNFIF